MTKSEDKRIKLRDKLKKLVALLGSSNSHEREVARGKIDDLLTSHKRNWNDLVPLLAAGTGSAAQEDTGDRDEPDDRSSSVNVLDLIRHTLQKHLKLAEHQCVAVALWICHTFVFDRFAVTPRLALLSPVRGCGKTTALNLISALAAELRRADHISAAAIFPMTHSDRPTLLLDEVDNLDLMTNSALLAVANSGHRRGGKVARYVAPAVCEFSTFAPMALAAIGRLPLPLAHRSVVIRMARDQTGDLQRLDEHNKDQCAERDAIHRAIFNWSRRVQLNSDPAMPAELHDRRADNWRPLLAVADSFGPVWGDLARDAAVVLSRGHQDEDPAVTLLSDIRDTFYRHPTADRLATAVIIAELVDLPSGLWSEWRGPRDDQVARKLTPAGLARMLEPFGIRPKTIWPPRRGTTEKSAKGYHRHDFEAAWASYCDSTTSQRSNVRYLHRT
jgi:hypothetical protein